MNIPYEFSKIKESFSKVKQDMTYLSSQISHNYEEFMKSHKELSHRIDQLSQEIKYHIGNAKNQTQNGIESNDKHNLQLEIKELKKQIQDLEKNHSSLSFKVEEQANSKKDTKEIHDMKEKIHASELEIYLLKERMMEKDLEVKQLKDVNKQLFEIVDEIAKLEQDLVYK